MVDLEASAELPSILAANPVDVVFNIAEGFRGRNRESQVPALLELLDIPYTGSDPATLSLALDKALAERVRLRPDATVFVIARQPGSPMPVAAQKHAASELPFSAALSDADSPMPTLKLSQMREVELTLGIYGAGLNIDGAVPDETE